MTDSLEPHADAADASVAAGLTSDEASRRLAQFGPNATPDSKTNPFWLVLSKFLAPVPILLEAAIVLQLILGERVEAAVVGGLVIFNAALGLLHEGRAQATIAALKSKLALWASVRRDGTWTNVPIAQLVPGDVVKLSLGAVVGADVRLLCGAVLLDQSTITGESLPIEAGPGTETYAGALVRRGEAEAVVVATGARTKFGRAAELVRTAYVASAQQKAVFRVVRNLAAVNGGIVLFLIAYAYFIALPIGEVVPLALVAILGTVPVALPATFTLATALGSEALAKRGVLPTRLSAVDEAASMDVLCSDKTGTLTRNELAVTATWASPGFDKGRVLALAALASSEGGQDPVDHAVRAAAPHTEASGAKLVSFIPFDPATKMSEAIAETAGGSRLRVVKGAFATVARLARTPPEAPQAADDMQRQGFRVLGVAVGAPESLQLAGLLALSDPPRPDANACIAELRRLGVETVIVTGDAAATAGVIAKAVGVAGAVTPPGVIRDALQPQEFAVFAGVLPEDKFKLVKAFQKTGHTVGMCGDGANDAPALRQAQIGIAVSTATDVAKSAAGLVLTAPGLAGIVAAVHEGRVTFQRILTYTLRSIVWRVQQVLFLTIGLVMTGHAILTPMQMVLAMMTSDFLAMSSTTDNVEPSALPNAWRIGGLTLAGIVMGLCDLAFNVAVLSVGKYGLGFGIEALQTLALVTLVGGGQAIFYVVRERRRIWSSRPSVVVVLSSIADLTIIPTLAVRGILMAPIAPSIVAGVFAASIVFAFVLDVVKSITFRRLEIA